MPIVLGAILSMVLPFSVLFFGFTIGFAGFVLSGMSQWHYVDRETHFFNRDYLRDIAEQIKEKKASRGSMIVFDVSGDQDAFVNILKQELPTNREVISAGNGRFIFLSDKESRPKLRAAA